MSWKIELKEDVVVVYMNSNSMNLMNSGFFDDLNSTFDILESEHKNKPVVLTSEVNAFSAGLDITEIVPIKPLLENPIKIKRKKVRKIGNEYIEVPE